MEPGRFPEVIENMPPSVRPVERTVSLRVNGQDWSGPVRVTEVLLESLRERLRLTGTKRSCEEPICGACTVLVDGAAISSCTYLTIEADRREVLTVEGLERDGQLDALQDAFIRHGALQCGFCTPGMLMTATALLSEEPAPDRKMLKEYLRGSICRCGSYPAIEDAILDVVEHRAAQAPSRAAG
jgi:carbon-monoxide dehydrogenase small subunit